MGLRRTAEGALTQAQVLTVYTSMLQASCDKKRQRIERLLGASLTPIDEALRTRVAALGKSFGGKKELKIGVEEVAVMKQGGAWTVQYDAHEQQYWWQKGSGRTQTV